MRGRVGVVEQRDEVGVVAQVAQLVGDVAVVDVDRNRARLVAGEHDLDVLDRVAEIQPDVIADRRRPRLAARARGGSRARRARRRCAARRRTRPPRAPGTASATHSIRSAMLNSTLRSRGAFARRSAASYSPILARALTDLERSPRAARRLLAEGALHDRRVLRPRARSAVAARLADRGPRGGARRARRLPRVHDRRRLDRRRAHRARRARRVPQRVPAPRDPSRRRLRRVRERRDPLPVPRVDVRARRPARRACPTARSSSGLPDDLGLRPVRVDCWGGFVFVNMDLDAEPLLDFLDPLPTLLAPYRFDELRFRTYRTTIIDANWKAVVDAFNESYHVQGLHEQILPWTDDTSIAYEQFERHSHYGRLPGARARAAPEPAPRPARPTTTTKARSSARSSRAGRRVSRRGARSGRRVARVGAAARARRCSARIRSGA